MTDLHKAAQQALEAWQTATYGHPSHHKATLLAMTALRAALAQQAEPKGGGRLPPPLQAEPVAWRCACGANLYIDAQGRPASKAEPVQEPQTLGAAMQQPRAMAQAYENGYKAGAAAEREACAKVCEGGSFLHDDAPDARFGKACAAAIRARSNT